VESVCTSGRGCVGHGTGLHNYFDEHHAGIFFIRYIPLELVITNCCFNLLVYNRASLSFSALLVWCTSWKDSGSRTSSRLVCFPIASRY
jgi:hypothetical protein